MAFAITCVETLTISHKRWLSGDSLHSNSETQAISKWVTTEWCFTILALWSDGHASISRSHHLMIVSLQASCFISLDICLLMSQIIEPVALACCEDELRESMGSASTSP